jgi:hypothetical protein
VYQFWLFIEAYVQLEAARIRACMDLQNGCRSEYGPLELRIQTTSVENGFIVYVQDPRSSHPVVHEHHALSTLDSAKTYAVLQADDYLNGLGEAHDHSAKWRCS